MIDGKFGNEFSSQNRKPHLLTCHSYIENDILKQHKKIEFKHGLISRVMSISNLEDSVRNETSIFSVTFANRFLQIYTLFGLAGDGGRCPEPFTNDVSTRKVSNNYLKFLTLRNISSI